MYTYGELLDDMSYLSRYGVETGAIGASAYGRIIPYVKIGSGAHNIIVTAGIHAREHVSSLFAVRQMYKLFLEPPDCAVYFVPIVNPDGNVLVSDGAGEFGFDSGRIIELNGGSNDFSLWKANAAGVDLNVNFDARWGEGVHNERTAGSENYIGERPFSEPESTALARFTRKLKPVLTVSYHAKGQEIYYEFGQSGERLERDRKVAEHAARLTGYRLVEGTRGSAGGYKDWCISELGIPSLTVELVSDGYAHPLTDESIYADFSREPLLPVKLYEFMKANGYV